LYFPPFACEASRRENKKQKSFLYNRSYNISDNLTELQKHAATSASAAASAAGDTPRPVSRAALAGTRPWTQEDSILKDDDLQGIKTELVGALRDNCEVKVKITWRTQRRGQLIPPSAWAVWEGEVHSVDADGVLWLAFPQEQDNRPGVTVNPFPNARLDYSGFVVLSAIPKEMPGAKGVGGLPPVGGASAKKPRVETAPRNEPSSNADLDMRAVASCFLDAKAQKLTQPVKGGDGLRIPAAIPTRFAATYPPLWWQRKLEGEDVTSLVLEWREEWERLQRYAGAVFKLPTLRDEYEVCLDNITESLFAPLPPASKEKWKTCFHSVFRAIALLYTVTHGSSVASKTSKKLDDQWRSNLLDVEEAMRLDDGATSTESPAPPVPGDRALTAQIQKLQADNNTLRQQNQAIIQRLHAQEAQSFRGRGGRGGRGSGRAQF